MTDVEEWKAAWKRAKARTDRDNKKMIAGFKKMTDAQEWKAAWKRAKAQTDRDNKKIIVFDIPGSTIDFEQEICNEGRPCPGLVLLYARMGLHRYNLLEGTKFELSGVTKYVQSKGTCACCYYITLDAIDPAVGSSLQTFQTEVSEQSFGRYILMGQTSGRGASFVDSSLPEWPAENPFQKYYLVKESELQDNDWILLYIELAIAIVTNSEGKDFGPPKLEIVKVAMDAKDEGLNALNAIFYVRYKDLNEAEIGKALDRFAIVRRRFHEDTQCFSLVGSQVNQIWTPNESSSPLTTREIQRQENQYSNHIAIRT
ncbi:unnamed protein product [Microthlaspi erraticum]|uniref:Uncharacterized protein n=1 Tax=Microthlaspi erraticum TaxID=1685480 RepID=A0A6D2JJZ7_9BRAS|nr:unnamed protein product [Microthlaspi erraticum]